MAKRRLPQALKKEYFITNDSLIEIVGKDIASRQYITKRIWDYVKKNDLQDGQFILASEDDLLHDVFKGVKNKKGKKVMESDGGVFMTGVASAISAHTEAV